jgi:integrase
VAAVDTALVMKVLDPLWETKTETASRLRGRIETILNWAATRGYRQGENPARWRGHLENLLPKKTKVVSVQHHAALPYSEIGGFAAVLREQPGIAARALEFAILTATRTDEAIGAEWREINMAERLWTIPAVRMKGRREHRVPLSDAALAILEAMAAVRVSGLVFPGAQPNRSIHIGALRQVLAERMQRTDVTVHGFRSTFRDWAAERSAFPSEIAEMALAHQVGSEVERAYRRSDLFDKRRKLMEGWAAYYGATAPEEGQIVPLRRVNTP